MTTTTLKTCSRCRKEKQATAFHRNANQPDGLHNYCKACRSRVGGHIPTRWAPHVSEGGTFTYQDAGQPDPLSRLMEAKGFTLTPTSLRPFCAWMKPGVGYVWGSAATQHGANVWYAARKLEDVRYQRNVTEPDSERVACTSKHRRGSAEDAIAFLEGK